MSTPDREGIAWCRVGERLVFLDLKDDRYFRLQPSAERQVLERAAEEGRVLWHQPSAIARPASWAMPDSSCLSKLDRSFDLRAVASALWMQRRVERKLASRSLWEIVVGLRCLTEEGSTSAGRRSETILGCARAYEQARLLRSSATRCLAHSIALATSLAMRGVSCRVVIGVRSPPFGAHCWAQHDGEVLNDSLESVLRYEPILVI